MDRKGPLSGQTMNHGRSLQPCFMASQPQFSAFWFSLSCPPPHTSYSAPPLPLASSFQIILETQMFMYNIRADDLKRPLNVARSQRPLWINQPFFGLSFLGRPNIYTLGAGPIRAPQQIIHSCKQPSLVEKKSLLIGVTALILTAAGAELTRFSGVQTFPELQWILHK